MTLTSGTGGNTSAGGGRIYGGTAHLSLGDNKQLTAAKAAAAAPEVPSAAQYFADAFGEENETAAVRLTVTRMAPAVLRSHFLMRGPILHLQRSTLIFCPCGSKSSGLIAMCTAVISTSYQDELLHAMCIDTMASSPRRL